MFVVPNEPFPGKMQTTKGEIVREDLDQEQKVEDEPLLGDIGTGKLSFDDTFGSLTDVQLQSLVCHPIARWQLPLAPVHPRSLEGPQTRRKTRSVRWLLLRTWMLRLQ